ncbi:MAG: lamin tail domain-containing protein [Candidatus Marinimicrobia bacterium]|nr:lamin tail domain-containing protein [Candidatus Neomarinimicrobiota bacterium]
MDLVETNDGNLLIIGQGDNPETGSGDYMASLVDQSGNELWCQYYGITQTENAYAVSRAEDNGFTIGGYGSSPENVWRIYLLRIDENGDVVWESYSEGESGRESAYAMTKALDGGYVLAGDSGSSWENVQIVKFDQAGNVVWSNYIPYQPPQYTRSITNTMDGGFLISGHHYQSLIYDQWLLKIDSLGNFIWDQTFVTDYQDYGWSVEYIDDQSYFIAGSSNSQGYLTKIRPVASTGNVVINELMINPNVVNDNDGEWFEVVNTSGTIINLQGWQIVSHDENYLFDSEVFLYPNEYSIFSPNADFYTNGGVDVLHGYSALSLNNFEDEIILVDSLSNTIDSVVWNGSNGFPTASGVSSALINPILDNSVSASWSLSALTFGDGDYGTPGGPNYFSNINLGGPYYDLPQIMVGAVNTGVISINNTGNDTLRIDRVLSSNLEFEAIIVDSMVAPFSESNFNLNFYPSEFGVRTAQLFVYSNAYQNEEMEFQISGVAIPANSDISCTPDTIFFDTNTVLDTLIHEVDISNEGTLDLTINDIEVSSNPTDYDFSIYSGVVPPGRDVIFELSYHGPKSPAPEPNSLIIYSNDPDEPAYSIIILFHEVVHTELENIPKTYTLNQNYPNPFNPTTTLRYGLPEDNEVSLIIYDIRGNTISMIESESKQAGWYEHTWIGLNDYGQPVSTGLYLARLQAGSYSKVIKMVYLK